MRTIWLVLLCCLPTVDAQAQQVTVGAPSIGMSDNFFENTGVRFGFRYDSPTSRLFFSNGFGAPPAFGGFDPNTAANFGLSGRRGNWSWDFGLTASQGSSQSLVSNTPMLTLPNGGTGFFTNTSLRPFVTGIVPVVNDRRALEAITAQQLSMKTAERERFRQRFAEAAREVASKRRSEQIEQQKLADEVEFKSQLKRSSRSSQTEKVSEPPLILRNGVPDAM